MDMGDQKWRNDLFICYIIDPLDLPTHCDGYNAALYPRHALECKKNGLITTWNNERRDGVANHAGKSFTPLDMRNGPLINPCRAVREGKAQTMGSLINNLPTDIDTSDQ